MLGHATDDLKKAGSAGGVTNDILAWRRAVSVFSLMERMISRGDIEWTLSGASNRDDVMCSETSLRQDGVNHKLCAEIRLEKVSQSLTLMDYLYFMTYTVSTTGYGDLLPADAFVQLVVSVANLWEIFFVVICLNVILESSVRRLKRDESPQNQPVEDTPRPPPTAQL
jgi:Ion channel